MKHSEKMAPAAAVLAALSTLACCLPLGIAGAIGAAGLGFISGPLRPWMIGLSIVLLGVGAWQMYYRPSCERRSRTSLVILCSAAVIVGALVLFPQAIAGLIADLL